MNMIATLVESFRDRETPLDATIFAHAVYDRLAPPREPSRAAPRPAASATPNRLAARILNTFRMRADFLQFLCDIHARHSNHDLRPIDIDLLGPRMGLLQDPLHIKRVFKDTETFVRPEIFMKPFRASLGYSLVTVTQMEEWSSLRRRTLRYFSHQQLVAYGDGVADVLQRHAVPRLRDKAAANQPIDIFDEMLDIASIAVFANFLGDPVEAVPRATYLALNKAFEYLRDNIIALGYTPMWLPTRANREFMRHRAVIWDYLLPRIASDAAKDTMFGDVIRVHTRADGTRDVRTILEEVTSNLVGGSETTIVLMAWALYYIVQHDAVADQLVEEIQRVIGDRAPTTADLLKMPFLDAVVGETLRLRSPAYLTGRVAARDVEFDGHKFARGTYLITSQYITHLHPLVWQDPLAFKPERFKDGLASVMSKQDTGVSFFPFGFGKFICVGTQYALLEAKLMLATLLQRFRFSPADGPAFASVGVDARLTLRPSRPILVRAQLR